MTTSIRFAAITILSISMNLSLPAMASDEFDGLQDIIGKLDFEDKYNGFYVSQKCAGLYYSVAQHLPKSDVKGITTLAQIAAVFILTANAALKEKDPNLSDESRSKQVDSMMKATAKKYNSILEENQVNTGSIFNDWIQKELRICNSIIE